jgi:chitinase
LADFCLNSVVDIIPIGFVNVFPPAGNGYVGANHGNACWGGEGYYYKGPGYNGAPRVAGNDLLPNTCSPIQQGLPACQARGKKILLSVGGHPGAKTYRNQLKTAADGVFAANFLWNAYGPKNPSWTGPRPFDIPGSNKTSEVDGFDFDIETTVDGTNAALGKSSLTPKDVERWT